MLPQIIFSIEVFPLPLLPTIETNSPVLTVRLKPSKTHISVTEPGLYIFLIFSSVSIVFCPL